MGDAPDRNRFTDLVKEAAGKLTDDEVRNKVFQTAKRGTQTVADGAKTAVGVANSGLSKGTSVVSLRDYRQSMEAAMAQVVEVLSAHEAEITALRERLAMLEQARREP